MIDELVKSARGRRGMKSHRLFIRERDRETERASEDEALGVNTFV